VTFIECDLNSLLIRILSSKKDNGMDALSTLFGWLTGTWTKQNSIGKAFLGCVVLLIMACACGLPLLIISLMDM